MYTAAQIAAYMGIKEIYMTGVDHHFRVSRNSKGEVEIHVSKEIGVQTYFSTDFRYKIGSTVGGGGGVNHRMIKELTKGDVNADWSVDIYDAIEIQKAVVGKTKFDKAAKRRGEVNNDSTLDILDATCIQKYLVK